MKKLLTLAAAIEVATGLALMVAPSFVASLLLGEELIGVSIPVARVAGIGLLSLGLACWPAKEWARTALRAILTYNLLVTLYLLYLAIRGEWVGLLLWPCSCITLHFDGVAHAGVVQGEAGYIKLTSNPWFRGAAILCAKSAITIIAHGNALGLPGVKEYSP